MHRRVQGTRDLFGRTQAYQKSGCVSSGRPLPYLVEESARQNQRGHIQQGWLNFVLDIL